MAESFHILAIWPLVRGRVRDRTLAVVTQLEERPVARRVRLPHRAWIVAVVAFVTLIGAAGFRAVPSVLIDPLHAEFGWSRATISSAVSINLILFGLFSPFAAA